MSANLTSSSIRGCKVSSSGLYLWWLWQSEPRSDRSIRALGKNEIIPTRHSAARHSFSYGKLSDSRIAMLLSPNFSVVFFCCFEQLEMAIT